MWTSLTRSHPILKYLSNLRPEKRARSLSRIMSSEVDLSKHDSTQIKLLSEQCILVSPEDEVLGSDTKKNCHLNANIDSGLLHRAFSVFLFNGRGELLLQQRSSAKITFPDYFTNTCCSHPLYRPEELEEGEEIGVKRAAQRKLGHELGITSEQVPLDCFKFLTRIRYKAKSCDTWGEHEIDYILFAQRDVTLLVNPNEVQSTRYVNQEELKDLLDEGERGVVKVTPWFRLICNSFLFNWWENLSDLDKVKDTEKIHNMI